MPPTEMNTPATYVARLRPQLWTGDFCLPLYDWRNIRLNKFRQSVFADPSHPLAFTNNLSRTVVTHVRSGANSRSMLPPSYRLLSANRREAGMDSEGKKTRLTRGGQPPAVR